MKRYRAKRTWKSIPERLKRLVYEPPYHMPSEWEGTEPPFVYCEAPTMLVLEALGVPSAEWPYYLGYMKRMLALYKKFTDETLELETTSLIAEYVLRGYSQEVLEGVQVVAAGCAYVPPPLPFEFTETWDFGPTSQFTLQHTEPWSYKPLPTFTLEHTEPWSS